MHERIIFLFLSVYLEVEMKACCFMRKVCVHPISLRREFGPTVVEVDVGRGVLSVPVALIRLPVSSSVRFISLATVLVIYRCISSQL